MAMLSLVIPLCNKLVGVVCFRGGAIFGWWITEEMIVKFKITSEELPENCKEVIATRVLRYKEYKSNSQQYRSGLRGRWQEHDGYGWKNCDAPEGWIYLEDFNK